MNTLFKSAIAKTLAYTVATVSTLVTGLIVSALIALRPIFAIRTGLSTFKTLLNAKGDDVDTVTQDRSTYVGLVAFLGLLIPIHAAAYATQVPVTCALVVASLFALGFVGVRSIKIKGIEKLIVNTATVVLASVILSHLAPALNPHVLVASVLTGWTLAFLSSLRTIPKAVAIAIALCLGFYNAFQYGGILGCTIVLAGALIQLESISSALDCLAKAPDDKADAQLQYAFGSTLLQTTCVAAVITGLASFIH